MWWPKRHRPAAAPPRSTGTLYRRRERLPWPKDRDFRILSIDGGGIRGILPLAILSGLEERLPPGDSISNYFDMVVGTSTGGIIALGLGAGRTATNLYELYVDRGVEVFPDLGRLRKCLLAGAHFFVNRCDRAGLDNLIDEILQSKLIAESRVRLCVPAAEMLHFEPFIFKTPHHPDYKMDWSKTMALAARTTSAAPTYFTPVADGGYEFVDGGIWANNPIMVGVADALACFDIRREQIKVLSLGCVMDQYEMGFLRRYLGGMFFWKSIMFESMHIQSQNVIGQARLIAGGDRILRLDAPPVTPKFELWDWARCRREMPGMGEALLEQHREKVISMFLYDHAAPYGPFYP